MATQAPFDPSGYAATFHRDGYFLRNDVIAEEMIDGLRLAVAAIPNREEVRRKRSVYRESAVSQWIAQRRSDFLGGRNVR